MNYDWEADEQWKLYYNKQGMMKASANTKGAKKEADSMKRGYYATQVDKEFEKNFEFPDEETRN